jgi:hypothetical protein
MVKGMAECPVCGKIIFSSEWSRHKWRELNQRKVASRPLLKGADGRYRCVVPECLFPGTFSHTHLKEHLAKHTEAELMTSGIPLEVCISI